VSLEHSLGSGVLEGCVILNQIRGNTVITEGKTKLLVPTLSIESKVPPKKPAFYNPAATFSRDISIGICQAFGQRKNQPIEMADSLAGVGARGIRIAIEAPAISRVHLNDLNRDGLDLARSSADINGVLSKCTFSPEDVKMFFAKHSSPDKRFDIVDLDPYGSPAPYLESALAAVTGGGLLCITATDTAVLCGVYPEVARRKYYARSLRSEYCHETAARILVGALAHRAMPLNLGIRPLFGHTTRHYVRVYVSITVGSSQARSCQKGLGYIIHCSTCGARRVSKDVDRFCPDCGGKTGYAGPLWVQDINDPPFLRETCKVYEELGTPVCSKIVQTASEETELPPYYFALDNIARSNKTRSPSMNRTVVRLEEVGYRATRTIFNPKGIKTDAPLAEVERAAKEASESDSSSAFVTHPEKSKQTR